MWGGRLGWWLASDGPASIDPTQYGVAGILFAVLGGVILRMYLAQRSDFLQRIADLLQRIDKEATRAKDAEQARDRLVESTQHFLEGAYAKAMGSLDDARSTLVDSATQQRMLAQENEQLKRQIAALVEGQHRD